MDTQGNSCSNRDVLAAPPLDSPKQELNLFWLIVGGGFLLFLIRDSWLLLVALGLFERIDPRKPERLPFLFEIDARLLIPDGFRHSLDNDYAADGDQASEGGEGASGEDSGCGCGGCDGKWKRCSGRPIRETKPAIALICCSTKT